MKLRPMLRADVPAASAVSIAALGLDADTSPDVLHARHEPRVGHFVETDPDGAWVAEDGGEIIGVALATVREDVWGLSLLAVDPDHQARGTGGALLAASLRTARECRGALILSSVDPKAMRLYARAGFALHPCVSAAGIPVEPRPEPEAEEVSASEVAWLGRRMGRAVRGASYDPRDLRMLEEVGTRFLAISGRGFAGHREGSPRLLAADDDDAAAALLRTCLASGPRGGTVHVECLVAGNDWAIRTCLDAGLALSPEGPVFTRGEVGPLRPWIPSGALL